MMQYIFKRRQDGVHIINLKKTWEKLMLAARAIAAIENPADVFCVSSRPYGQRAVLKFARYIGATSIAGRFTPGKTQFSNVHGLLSAVESAVFISYRHAQVIFS